MILGRQPDRRAGRFGHAISMVEFAAKNRNRPLQQGFADRRRTIEKPLKAGEVHGIDPGHIDERLNDGRDEKGMSHTIGADRRDHRFGDWLLEQDCMSALA